MRKRSFIYLACLFLFASLRADDTATSAGATNVRIDQRAATTPYGRAPVNIKGSDNPWEAIGFNGSGILGAISLSEMFSGSGYTVGSSQITDGSIANADVASDAAIADSKLATISTAGKVSDSALSANVALENTANTFSQPQTTQLAGSALGTWRRSDGVADGTGQELRIILGTGGGSTSGALLGHYSLTSSTPTARNFFRFYDTGMRMDDESSNTMFDVNFSTDTVGIGAASGSEQFYGKLYIGGTYNTSATNNVRGILVNPTVTLGSGFAIAGYDVSLTTLGTANNDHIAGFQSRAIHNSNGTLNNHTGFVSIPVNNGGLNTNVNHFYAYDTTGTGSVTNQYGLYVAPLSKATNNWGVYVDGTTKSYFGGPVSQPSAPIYVPTAMGALVVDLTKSLNTKTITGNVTVSFSGSLANGQWSELRVENSGASEYTVTLPASVYSSSGSSTVSSFSVPAAAGGVNGLTHVAFSSDGTRTRIYQGGGTSGFPNPATEDLNMEGYDIENAGAITATTVEANLSGSTAIPGSEIVGPLPDLIYGKITTPEGFVFQSNDIAATTGSTITVLTSASENEIILNEATETVAFNAQPEKGKEFRVRIVPHSSACTVAWPSTWSFVTGGLRTSFVVPANKPQLITVWWDGTSYKMSGDPLEISELAEDTTPAITASVPIDQGAGTERASLASIRALMGTTFNGTAATPNTSATVAVTFDTLTYYHFAGAVQELDFPAAASYSGRGIVIEWGGSYVVTVDPSGSEKLIYNGSEAAADGEALDLTGTIGQVLVFKSDGTNWSVASNGPASIAEDIP